VVDGHEANVGHFGQARLNLQRSEIKRRQSGAIIIKRFSWSLMLRQNKLEPARGFDSGKHFHFRQ
jgi:hypothetical protein